MALPCWRKPRLYIVSRHWKQRWKDSEFYPAFKPHAKLFKLAVRMAAALNFFPVRKAGGLSGVQNLKNLVSFDRPAVLVGVEGPTQKLIARCLDLEGRPVAYIKYGEKPLAIAKLGNEADVLSRTSSARSVVAPQLLWCGEMGHGRAIIISAVEGEMLEARLSTSVDDDQLMAVKEYLERLRISDEWFAIEEHPAIIRLRKQVDILGPQSSVIRPQDFEKILSPLRGKTWPLAIQHGDFTPWNTIRISESRVKRNVLGVRTSADLKPNHVKLKTGTSLRLCAIDWEEGTTDGFPHFDLVYYVLQTAFLIHNWSPERAFAYARSVISSQLSVDGGGSTTNNYQQSTEQAEAIIRLASLDACFRFESRTGAKAEALRQFRLNIINR